MTNIFLKIKIRANNLWYVKYDKINIIDVPFAFNFQDGLAWKIQNSHYSEIITVINISMIVCLEYKYFKQGNSYNTSATTYYH
jgi:hypothetical protein